MKEGKAERAGSSNTVFLDYVIKAACFDSSTP